MERTSLPVGVQQLYKWYFDKGTLRFDIPYQRKCGYWNITTKSMFIWSMLANSYIPPIVFVKSDVDAVDERGKSMSRYSVLDGSHRLHVVFSYMNNEFELVGSTPSVCIDGDEFRLSGLKYDNLPQELKNLISSYKFSIQSISNATEEELTLLYININSGKELSTLAKAKPRLGSELCEYFAEVGEKPFISQGLCLSASQALKEEDLAIMLQGLMCISEYEDYKSLSLMECLKFADWLHDNMDDQLKKDFADIIDYLSVFKERTKYLKKNNTSAIIRLADQMLLEGIPAEKFKLFLDIFFFNTPEAYKEASGEGNVKLNKANERYEILASAAERHFDIKILDDAPVEDAEENSEANSGIPSSLGESQPESDSSAASDGGDVIEK